MNSIDRYTIEHDEKWREISKDIPELKFPEGWGIRIIPPFAGAISRFVVNCGEAKVSVYLDFYDALGIVGEPYWEIYPYEDDTARYLLNETDELINGIRQSIDQQLSDKTPLDQDGEGA
jgi:hypothetical protein